MPAPLAIAPLLAGAGKVALGKLPLIMGVGAALPSLRQGRPVEAALQGGLGYLGGRSILGELQVALFLEWLEVYRKLFKKWLRDLLQN